MPNTLVMLFLCLHCKTSIQLPLPFPEHREYIHSRVHSTVAHSIMKPPLSFDLASQYLIPRPQTPCLSALPQRKYLTSPRVRHTLLTTPPCQATPPPINRHASQTLPWPAHPPLCPHRRCRRKGSSPSPSSHSRPNKKEMGTWQGADERRI